MSATGIHLKLIRALVLQMLFISIVTALGVLAAAAVVEQVMMRTALASEAKHFWQEYDKDRSHPPPNTHNLLGFFAPAGNTSQIPERLTAIQTDFGFGRVDYDGRKPIVFVDQRGADRLYLVFDEESVLSLSFYFGVIPLSLILIVIYASAWFVYRFSFKSLSPLISLADTMQHYDFSKQQLDSLNLDSYSGPEIDNEVRVLADSLKQFTRKLREQLLRERAFTHDVSHELRTPLAVIRGSLGILAKQTDLQPVQQRAISRMQTTSRDMLSLIETLLWLAREQAGRDTLVETVDINALLPPLIEQIQQTHNSDQHVSLLLKQSTTLSIEAPSQAVAIVLGNVLRNACNYSTEGDIVITIGSDNVTIEDNGAGVDTAQINTLQQPFERGENQQVGDVPGYGLGLDIVRRLCERFDWTLHIESPANQGTTVSVTFR